MTIFLKQQSAMCNRLIYMLILTIYLVSECQIVTSADFLPVIHWVTGSPLCAVDNATVEVPVSSLVGIPSSVPNEVQCGFTCTGLSSCISFNYVRDPVAKCALYTFTPTTCRASSDGNCRHFESQKHTSCISVGNVTLGNTAWQSSSWLPDNSSVVSSSPISCISTNNVLSNTSGSSASWAIELSQPVIPSNLMFNVRGCTVSILNIKWSSSMYVYGQDNRDTAALLQPPAYRWTDPISFELPFFGKTRNNLTIGKNGFIAFDTNPTSAILTSPNILAQFPVETGMVAVLYTNYLDSSVGKVWWRVTSDATQLANATRDIQPYFTFPGSYVFNARQLFIATWSAVTSSLGNQNTFQVVLATDGVVSFAMLNYDTVATIFDAKVGFNAGYSNLLFTHPSSMTNNVADLDVHSNVGVKGRWLYRVDGASIRQPDCVGVTLTTKSGEKLKVLLNTDGAAVIPSTSDATPFLLVPCNSDATYLSTYSLPSGKCVSLMSVYLPGTFIRHSGLVLSVTSGSGDPFIYDSSFILRENQFYTGYYALQAVTSCCQSYYIQVQTSSNAKISIFATSSQNDADRASFTFGNTAGDHLPTTWNETIVIEFSNIAPTAGAPSVKVAMTTPCDGSRGVVPYGSTVGLQCPAAGFTLARYLVMQNPKTGNEMLCNVQVTGRVQIVIPAN